MQHYCMRRLSVLDAANAFYKAAVDPVSTDDKYNQIVHFAGVLANPRPITAFSGNLNSLNGGLAKTLEDRVKSWYTAEGSREWPIASADAKQKATAFFEDSKLFYSSLAQKKDYASILNDFTRVRQHWDNFKRDYFTREFLDIELQQKNNPNYNFWRDLRKYLDDAIGSLEALIKQGQAAANDPTQQGN